MRVLPFSIVFLGITSSFALKAEASIRPERIHVADSKKLDSYVRDGLFVGGDRAIDDVTVQKIRWARNKGYERIVLDLQTQRNGEALAIDRPPFYQISITPDEGRMTVSLWGNPKLNFNAPKTVREFSRSQMIKKIILLPKVEENIWTFAFELKTPPSVEVFELKNPTRIILDLKPR